MVNFRQLILIFICLIASACADVSLPQRVPLNFVGAPGLLIFRSDIICQEYSEKIIICINSDGNYTYAYIRFKVK